jgi:hypothetical protein
MMFAHGVEPRCPFLSSALKTRLWETHRHQEARSWDIENMFADLKPLLDEFVELFAAND